MEVDEISKNIAIYENKQFSYLAAILNQNGHHFSKI